LDFFFFFDDSFLASSGIASGWSIAGAGSPSAAYFSTVGNQQNGSLVAQYSGLAHIQPKQLHRAEVNRWGT
jgi:hypothetical protein